MSNPTRYPQLPKSEPPPHVPHANHGGTPAGWTFMVVAGVGALVLGVGIALQSLTVSVAGLIVVAAAIVIALIMRGMGLGQPDRPPASDSEDEYAHLRSPRKQSRTQHAASQRPEQVAQDPERVAQGEQAGETGDAQEVAEQAHDEQGRTQR